MTNITRRELTAGVALAAILAVTPKALADEVADVIYSGGSILTMDDSNPRSEAVAVKGGRIIAVGTAANVMKLKGDTTQLVDLDGRTMLPGFVDPHSHVTMGGLQAMTANLLPPPDGTSDSIEALLQTMKDWVAANGELISKTKLILGFGFDPAMLKEHRAPTKQELDTVSSDYPVFCVNQTGHSGVLNSKGLELVGYSAETPNPPGGSIDRMPGSQEPNGSIQEEAFFSAVPKVLGSIGPTGMMELARRGTEIWASYGYTTAQEGRATAPLADILKAVGKEGGLKIDVVAYVDALIAKDYITQNQSRSYQDRFRVGGAKLVIDGTPQGFTAWRDQPYYDPVGDYPPGYAGSPSITSREAIDAIDWAYTNGVQIITHSNGEAASDLLIASIQAAQDKHGRLPIRPVLVHGQFQREDQVQRFVDLGVFPSLFPMHTYYWGDWHRTRTVGPALADNISPTGWYRERGSMFSSHTDAPVALPDTMRVLSSTVNRRTRSNDILGPDQCVSVETALKAMTIWPAFQHFEEAEKGSIEKGKLADFVILTGDPTSIDQDAIYDIKVAETIKEGVSVYKASPEKLQRKSGIDTGMGTPFSNFLTRLATQRDLNSMPQKYKTPLIRKLVAANPQHGTCVSGVLFDMTRAILG